MQRAEGAEDENDGAEEDQQVGEEVLDGVLVAQADEDERRNEEADDGAGGRADQRQHQLHVREDNGHGHCGDNEQHRQQAKVGVGHGVRRVGGAEDVAVAVAGAEEQRVEAGAAGEEAQREAGQKGEQKEEQGELGEEAARQRLQDVPGDPGHVEEGEVAEEADQRVGDGGEEDGPLRGLDHELQRAEGVRLVEVLLEDLEDLPLTGKCHGEDGQVGDDEGRVPEIDLRPDVQRRRLLRLRLLRGEELVEGK